MCFLSEVSQCRITFNKQNFYITNSKSDSAYYPVYSVLVWLFHGYYWVLTRTHIQTDKHVKRMKGLLGFLVSSWIPTRRKCGMGKHHKIRWIDKYVLWLLFAETFVDKTIFSAHSKKNNSICTLFCLFCSVTDLFRRYCSRIYRWQNGHRTTDQCSLIFICRIALKIIIDMFTFWIISWMWLHPSR